MAAAAITCWTAKSGVPSPALLLSNGLRPRPPHHNQHYLHLNRPIPFCFPTRPICCSRRVVVFSGILPVDPWAPGTVDSQSVASQLFALSLLPYLGFLYFITKSNSAPKLTLFGFYFLLAFVGATIPAGIYAKVHYGTSLSNVDWLHGGAESLLTLTNLFIVLGLRMGLRKNSKDTDEVILDAEDKERSSV